MNSFDIAVYLGLMIAVATGFNTGLLRSAVTILAYLIAMPIAVWAMSEAGLGDRRPKRLPVAAAGRDGDGRPPEAGTSDLAERPGAPVMHFCDARSLIRAAEVGYSAAVRL
jgi:hypothetical protein